MDQSQEKREHSGEIVNEWTQDGAPPEHEVIDIQVPEEKAEEYTSHFPALGTEPEQVHPETEFNPEILEAETQFAATESSEVINSFFLPFSPSQRINFIFQLKIFLRKE
mgnify:CR=1 FL=1